MRPQACRARVENGVGFCRILLRRGARVHSRGAAVVVEHPALVAVRVGRPSNAGRDLRQLQRSASASASFRRLVAKRTKRLRRIDGPRAGAAISKTTPSDPVLAPQLASFLARRPPARLRNARDNSYQLFAELDEKAVFLPTAWCGRTASVPAWR